VAIKGVKENKNAGVTEVAPRPAMLAGLGGEAAVKRLAASAVLAEISAGVGPGGYCPPRHSTHYEPTSFELNGTL